MAVTVTPPADAPVIVSVDGSPVCATRAGNVRCTCRDGGEPRRRSVASQGHAAFRPPRLEARFEIVQCENRSEG